MPSDLSGGLKRIRSIGFSQITNEKNLAKANIVLILYSSNYDSTQLINQQEAIDSGLIIII